MRIDRQHVVIVAPRLGGTPGFLRVGGKAVDVRVSTLPTGHGERAVLRLLERCDAFRKPQRFREILLACECDARGRQGVRERNARRGTADDAAADAFDRRAHVVAAHVDRVQHRFAGRQTPLVFLVTSQRELVSNYGKPMFLVSEGTPVHGYELNEYGLLAAYSALGVSNAAYILRADINLDQLSSSLTRPHGAVAANTLWLDTDNTSFGVFEWNASPPSVSGGQRFANKVPTVITDTADLEPSTPVPLQSLGTMVTMLLLQLVHLILAILNVAVLHQHKLVTLL